MNSVYKVLPDFKVLSIHKWAGGGGGVGGRDVTNVLSDFICCLHGICPQKTFLRYCQSAIATGEAHDLPGDTVADTVLKCYYEI
jgi:hypothetical protein